MSEEAEELAIHRRLKAHMRATREGRGWNQARMAVFLGVTQANYQKYESNDPKRKVPFVVAIRYCDNLGISLYDVIQPGRRRA